ncbi:MAG: hypothetical protein SGJ11_01480 [Phycisphaerae bacterium]|nr:hypothetical protein [Phycisphaerae bacterium]
MPGTIRVSRLVVRAGIAAAALASCSGCVKPLFPESAPRTQFETYDRMRSRYVPLEEPDVFGVPRPALRARLGPQTR